MNAVTEGHGDCAAVFDVARRSTHADGSDFRMVDDVVARDAWIDLDRWNTSIHGVVLMTIQHRGVAGLIAERDRHFHTVIHIRNQCIPRHCDAPGRAIERRRVVLAIHAHHENDVGHIGWNSSQCAGQSHAALGFRGIDQIVIRHRIGGQLDAAQIRGRGVQNQRKAWAPAAFIADRVDAGGGDQMRAFRGERRHGVAPVAVAVHRRAANELVAIVEVDLVAHDATAAEGWRGVIGDITTGEWALLGTHIIHGRVNARHAGGHGVHGQREAGRQGVSRHVLGLCFIGVLAIHLHR